MTKNTKKTKQHHAARSTPKTMSDPTMPGRMEARRRKYRAECIRIDDEILGMVDRMDLASRFERDQMCARIAILRDRKDRMEAELVAARGKHGDAATGSE